MCMSAHSNPYTPPQDKEPNAWPGEILSVEDATICVRDHSTLPSICVITGRPLDEKTAITATFRLAKWGDLHPRSCHVRYYLSPNHRRKYRLIQVFLLVARSSVILGLLSLLIFWTSWYERYLHWYLIVSGLLSVVLSAFPLHPIKIVDHNDGRFTLSGFGHAFLEKVSNLQTDKPTEQFQSS